MLGTHAGGADGRPAALRPRRSVLVAMALVVAVLSTGLTAGVADAAGTMTVTPATGLIDGQSVHVVGVGLAANSPAIMEQCLTGHGIEGCDPTTQTYNPTDASGSFATDVRVLTIMHTSLGTIDCRTNVDPCVLGASTSGGPDGAISATLGFDPSGPLLPPPVVTATPDTGLIDAQVIAVDGTGFRVTPSYYLPIEIRQCVTGATSYDDCHSSQYQDYNPVHPDGSWHGSIRVHGIIATDGGDTVDCRTTPTACELLVGTFYPSIDAVAVPISFDPDAPAVPPATITVTPATDLVDGQAMHVNGTGFLANSPVGLSQCASSTTSGTCAGGSFVYTDAVGDVDATLPARARLWAGEILDCRDPSIECSVQATSYEDYDQHPRFPISFDPGGRPAPASGPRRDPVDRPGRRPGRDAHRHQHLQPLRPDHRRSDQRRPSRRQVGRASDTTGGLPGRQRGRVGSCSDPAVAVAFSVPIIECLTTDVFDFIGCDPNSYSQADVDDSGNLTGTAQVAAVFRSFTGEDIDCRTAVNKCSLYLFGSGDPLTSASATLDFDPNGPLAPPPTITVTPTTDLVDGQELHVVGDGFPPNAVISLHQCLADKTGLDGCDTDLFGIVVSDSQGHIDMTTTAKQVIGLGTDGDPYSQTFDCGSAPNACRLLFEDYKPVSAWPSVTLSYATAATPPAAPPATPPTQVVVQPQFTG